MNEAFLIYLLSIAENMADTLSTCGTVACVVAIVLYGLSTVIHWARMDVQEVEQRERPAVRQAERDRWTAAEPQVRKISLTLAVVTAFSWFFGAMWPSTESVLKSYALIEGSKVINAENAELAAEAVGKRFDKFLDIVDRGINGRAAAPAPAPAPAPQEPANAAQSPNK